VTATWKWYGNGLRHALLGDLKFGTDTFKLMLTSDLYIPNRDTHEFRSSVTNEVAPSGTYAAGGVTVAGVAASYDAASDQARVVWNDTVIANCTITCRTSVLYKSTGNASTDILVAYATESINIAAVNGSLTLDQSVPCLYITAL
jgi:hypothetical protein